MLVAVGITGAAALNGALLFKLLRFLALGALLLAGTRKPAQPILKLSWWMAALALSAFPFFCWIQQRLACHQRRGGGWPGLGRWHWRQLAGPAAGHAGNRTGWRHSVCSHG